MFAAITEITVMNDPIMAWSLKSDEKGEYSVGVYSVSSDVNKEAADSRASDEALYITECSSLGVHISVESEVFEGHSKVDFTDPIAVEAIDA